MDIRAFLTTKGVRVCCWLLFCFFNLKLLNWWKHLNQYLYYFRNSKRGCAQGHKNSLYIYVSIKRRRPVTGNSIRTPQTEVIRIFIMWLVCHVTLKMASVNNTVVFLIFLYISCSLAKYDPTWESIDSRPLPPWYDEAKLGIFVHWGVFSVPSYSSEWFWQNWKQQKLPGIEEFMRENYKADFTYQDFAKDFSAEFFISDQWADIFNSSGAR